MRSIIAIVLALACLVALVQAKGHDSDVHASPIGASAPHAVTGKPGRSSSNPVLPNLPRAHDALTKEKQKPAQYLKGKDFLGAYASVPINPTAHLQRVLQKDRQYVASILRQPLDLGDPTNCKHSDLENDQRQLRQIALRINHRRVALRQQQHWIDEATEGLRKIENEITATTATARNLAEQLDTLEAQKTDISNHVRRAALLKELDNTSTNLMRLKDQRVKDEIKAQRKHNKFARRNDRHNRVLKKLRSMRKGSPLGKLPDNTHYRFAAEGMEAAAEDKNQAEGETSAETDADSENQVDADQEQETEQAAEAESESKTEAESETEQSTETEGEAEAEKEEKKSE